MKTAVLLFFILSNISIAHTQNVGIGTTTPAGKVHIKGSHDTTQLVIDANATQSNTQPLIRLRNAVGDDIMHIHADKQSNLFIGVDAGKLNTYGRYNNFVGLFSGSSNISGSYNIANGAYSLYKNSTGESNTAMGDNTLYSNTTGFLNVAVGHRSLVFNSTGYENIAVGPNALYSNTTGSYNTTSGSNALLINSSGSSNTAIGYNALYATTVSSYNTAVGFNAGSSYDNGFNNVFVGAGANVNGGGYFNVIAIGKGAVCTTPSQVTIGNSSTNSYRAYANWTNISDGRFKNNVQENVPGLDFITKLRPVTYNLNATALDVFLHKNVTQAKGEINEGSLINKDIRDALYTKAMHEKEAEVITGFVAQEVAAAAKEMGFNFSGVDAPKNESDTYGLRYAEFVVPLVKGMQEQQQMIKVMKSRIDELEFQLKLLLQEVKGATDNK